MSQPISEANQPLKVSPADYAPIIDKNWPLPSEEAFTVALYHMKLYYDVKMSSLPNYLSVRRQVPSDLNCDRWDDLLTDYHDSEICNFLRFGWPVTYTSPDLPTASHVNHASATRHGGAVDAFIRKELDKDALLGPFLQPHFRPWTQTSPLMTRDKPDSTGKGVIIDLSFPEGASVNDGIIKNFYQGKNSAYQLPTALDLADLLLEAGVGAFMWKSDLTRAYRQLRIDPLDYPLLAIKHRGLYYLDVCPSFGCRASGGAQQRVSNTVTSLMSDRGHPTLAYVDDFCGIGKTKDIAEASYN